MAAVQSTRPASGQSLRLNVATAGTAVQRALDLLSRASEDWRNGTPRESGSLHWPVAVNLARRELCQALEALDNPQWHCICGREHCPGACMESVGFEDVENARAGIAWWNNLSRAERRYWLERAGSAVPADAWRAFQAGGSPR
ncbi:MAG: hypothetical protein ACRET2_02205 [Steroidobacteraceae bacterium]